MKHREGEPRGESEALHRASDFDIAVVRGAAVQGNLEIRQLLVLCIGMAGLIAADALIWIYFWVI
jgi:hypothetical protein